jgi:hypothetical protein
MSDSKKPTVREILAFIWDTKIFLFYLKLGVVLWVAGGLIVFLYWLVTGEIPE